MLVNSVNSAINRISPASGNPQANQESGYLSYQQIDNQANSLTSSTLR